MNIKKEISCLIKQTDCFQNTQQVLHHGKALIEENKVSFQGKDNHFYEIHFEESTIQLCRTGEQKTVVSLMVGQSGEASVDSDLGRITLETNLLVYKRNSQSWELEYQLLDSQEVLVHNHLYCQW